MVNLNKQCIVNFDLKSKIIKNQNRFSMNSKYYELFISLYIKNDANVRIQDRKINCVKQFTSKILHINL